MNAANSSKNRSQPSKEYAIILQMLHNVCLIPIPIQLRTRIDLDLEPEMVPRNITGSLKIIPSQLTAQYDRVIT